MTDIPPSIWIKCYRPRPAARLRLLCFPYAGAGASVFRAWWQQLPEDIEVSAVQLPGREDRYREPPLRRMPELMAALAAVLPPEAGVPFAFFGHSMGALIAFELARQRSRAGRPLPVRLLVSGRRAPQLAEPRQTIGHLADDRFVQELQQRYGGIPPAIAESRELLSLFLPTVRADLELVDSYRCQPAPPLDCPISVFGGLRDAIGRHELEAWSEQTTAALRLHLLPGDHFFVNTQTAALLRHIVADLESGPWQRGPK